MIALPLGLSSEENLRTLVFAAKGSTRRRAGRQPLARWPHPSERAYYRGVMRLVEQIDGAVRSTVIPGLAQLLDEAASSRPTYDSAHNDAWGDFGAHLMRLLRALVSGFVTGRELDDLMISIATDIDKVSRGNQVRSLRAAIGVDVFASEPWLEAELRSFVSQNVALIKGVAERHVADVERIVFDGARRGLTYNALAKDLAKSPAIRSERAAAFIARDQVAKFTGQLNQLRQRQIGVKSYIWRTSRDSRVRDDHRVREGVTFSWEAPPFDGHPGQAFLCRCYAEPQLDELLDELDVEPFKERA